MLPLEEPLKIGLIVLACVAGARSWSRRSNLEGGPPTGVGLMFLLMVVTIVYVPLVLPLLLQGVDVNAWDIASR